MKYFYQDTLYVSLSLILLLVLIIFMLWQRRFPKGSPLLIGLVFLLSSAGLADLTFRFNPLPNLVLLADSMNVFCFTFALAILLHYSVVYASQTPLWKETKLYLLLYLPAVIISVAHALSPFTIKGIVSGPIGFQLSYNPGYWIIVSYATIFGLLSLFLNLRVISRKRAEEKNQLLFLLLVLVLVIYFYHSSLILPFLFKMVNFASPLPTAAAVLALVYAFIKYKYFTLENFSPKSSSP